MSAPLSNDLRRRVVNAIEKGISRRAAAIQFDISVASAVRWHQRFKRTGSVEPDAMGGDHHSYRAEAHAVRVLEWIDVKCDLTLVEICERLAKEGHIFAPSTIWRLLDRHNYTLKKRQPTPVSRNAMM